MNRKDREKALSANEHSPIRTLAALAALSDKELEGLEAHVTKKADEKKAADEAAARAAAEKAAADKKKADDEAAARAAAASGATMTAEQWYSLAPPEVRALVDDAKQREEAEKTRLFTVLKDSQKEYTEAELKAMSTRELTRVARLLGVDQPTAAAADYSGRGLPYSGSDPKNDVYRNPPNGYRMALEARKAAEKGQVN
jgi:hypothetical protein